VIFVTRADRTYITPVRIMDEHSFFLNTKMELRCCGTIPTPRLQVVHKTAVILVVSNDCRVTFRSTAEINDSMFVVSLPGAWQEIAYGENI